MRNNPYPDDVLEKIDADEVEEEEVIAPPTQRRRRPQPSPIPARASATPDVTTQHQRYAPDMQPPPQPPVRKQIDTDQLPKPSGKHPWLYPVLLGMLVMAMVFWACAVYVVP
jgi:hypothetical protein